MADEQWAAPEIDRLEELRLQATEDRVDARLALGRHAALVPELERLVGRHPYRERLVGQCMLALYRSGRQADALAPTGTQGARWSMSLDWSPVASSVASRARSSRTIRHWIWRSQIQRQQSRRPFHIDNRDGAQR